MSKWHKFQGMNMTLKGAIILDREIHIAIYLIKSKVDENTVNSRQ
jgi:hypothetical protein